MKEQKLFAKLSGDYNPVHLNPIFARRSIKGVVIVHGIYAALLGLEFYSKKIGAETELAHLHISFQEPISIRQKMLYDCEKKTDNHYIIHVIVNEKSAVVLDIKCYKMTETEPIKIQEYHSPASEPVTRKKIDENESGYIKINWCTKTAKKLFPNLMTSLPSWQIAEICATSRLVGMECPGLNSIFFKLDMHFLKPTNSLSTLKYKVEKFDDLFKLATIKIKTSGAEGKLEAFLAPKRVKQLSFKTIKFNYKNLPDFSNQKALVIGGSRGIGEITTKLLISGGADVRFTFFQGKDEANELIKEIKENGYNSKAYKLNILECKLALKNIFADEWKPTHCYYFATPHISRTPRQKLKKHIFLSYYEYYIEGFFNLLNQLNKNGFASDLNYMIFPSTTMIDEKNIDMKEYVIAKSAAETLATLLEKMFPRITILAPRIPRVKTDQTNSLIPIKCCPTTETILSMLTKIK